MARPPGWHHDLSPATRWVLAHGCATDLDPPDAVLDDDAWAQLRVEARAHGLEGLLVDAVATEAMRASPTQADELAELEIDLTRTRLWQERQLVAVVDLVERAGVAVRVLKGLAVATLDYPDPQMRPTGDVDLLVRAEDLERAGRAITAAGGTRIDPDPRPGYASVVGKGATYQTAAGEIDLHRLLVWGPLGVRLDPHLLWARSRSFTIGERHLATLSREDTLLHACCHLLVLGARRARQLRDVAQLIGHPDLDAEEVLVRAHQWGVEAVLATAVVLTARELRLRLDDELSEWAVGYAPRWRDRLWLRVERPGQPVAGLEAAATFVELPTRQARLEMVRATLRPAPGTWPRPTERVLGFTRRVVGDR